MEKKPAWFNTRYTTPTCSNEKYRGNSMVKAIPEAAVIPRAARADTALLFSSLSKTEPRSGNDATCIHQLLASKQCSIQKLELSVIHQDDNYIGPSQRLLYLCQTQLADFRFSE